MTPTLEAIRRSAEFLRGSCMHFENLAPGQTCSEVFGAPCAYCRSANELDQYADLLAQRARETCSTCTHWGAPVPYSPDCECEFFTRCEETITTEPTFTCAGWTAKEAK